MKCKAVIDNKKCSEKFKSSFIGHHWCDKNGHQDAVLKTVIANIRKDKAKEFDKETKRRRASIKPKNTILNEAQTAFNAYIRYRDKDLPCINTGQPVEYDGNASDAAHFVSRAANNAMRFDMRNVNKSTKASNKHQEKYIHEYRNNLIKKLGEVRFKQFEDDCRYYKTHQRNFSKQYLERIKRVFRKKLRVLKKLRGD